MEFCIEEVSVIQRFRKSRSSRALDLFHLDTSTTMERTKLLVSCLLLYTLSWTFLRSGTVSEIHFIPSRSASEREAICLLQMRALGENVVSRTCWSLFWFKISKLYQDLSTLNNSKKNQTEISLSHFYFNRSKEKRIWQKHCVLRRDFKYGADKRIDDALLATLYDHILAITFQITFHVA